MVKKAVSFFYPKDPSSDVQTPQLLDGLLNQCREVILANMKQAASLTHGILKSLYPRADLDVGSELKLVEDSALMADRIGDMVLIDMS
jgi:hypothetical protein